MRKTLLFGFLLLASFSLKLSAQNNATVFDPTLPTRYLSSSDSSPAVPPNDNNAYRWYAKKIQNWDTSPYKAYIYNGMAFRLRYPKNYNSSDTTKYPLLLSFAGVGAQGTIYDNDAQIDIIHENNLQNGKYNGFILYPYTPSSSNGFYNDVNYDKIAPLIAIICSNTRADINRVVNDGYSGGGIAVVEMLAKYPKLFAAATPISVINGWRNPTGMAEIPIWVFQGALDTNPKPYDTGVAVQNLLNVGANVKYTVYPKLGHGSWVTAWGEADFYPFVNKANKANPIVYFGRTEFCSEIYFE